MTTTDLAELPNPYTIRFKGFIARSIGVARRRIEAAGIDAPISDEARDRAQNVLSYALQDGEVWAETRDLLLTMAPKMEMAGHRNEWIQCLQTGIAQSQQQRDRLAEAELRFHCGYLYRLLSKYDQASQLLHTSAQIYSTLGEAENEARALNQLAYLAWQQHHYEAAARLANTAIAMVDELSLEKAMSLSALGLTAIEQYRWLEAEEYHRAALQIRTTHSNRRQMAWSQQNLGYALRGQGKYTEAIAFYEEAITTLTELNDLGNCAIVQMNLGIVYSMQGKATQALEMYSIAEAIFHRFADEFNLAKVLTSEGIDHLALQEWKQAEYVFKRSMELFEHLSNKSLYLNALDGLGMSYIGQELYNKALETFETVLVQLPLIKGTPAYNLLTRQISSQITQAKERSEGAPGWAAPRTL